MSIISEGRDSGSPAVDQAEGLEALTAACIALFETDFAGYEGLIGTPALPALLRVLNSHAAVCSTLIIEQDDDIRGLKRKLADLEEALKPGPKTIAAVPA
jgi:hypothetical protein